MTGRPEQHWRLGVGDRVPDVTRRHQGV